MAKETAKQDLESIQAIIKDAAAKEGVDPELMLKIGGAESSFRPGVKNPKSTAKGLFGFLDSSWKEMGGKPGEQYIPEKNAEMGAKLIKKNFEALSSALGREPSYGEVYAAHFFGQHGAKTLLTKADPNAPIEKSLAMFESPKRVQKVLKQNPNLQGKTTGQVIEELNAKMASKNKPAPVAQEPAPTKQGPSWFRRPVPQFIRSEAPNLGTGYNAAFALMGMSDDELTTAQEIVAQNEEDNAVANFSQAKQMLAGIQAPNAFAKQPKMLSKGGEAKKDDKDSDHDKRAVQFFEELKEPGKDLSIRPTFELAPSSTVIPGIGHQIVPATVTGKLEAELPLLNGQVKAGVSGIATKPQGQKVMMMPGDFSMGYSTQQGPHQVSLEARRSINPMPSPTGGRGHMYGANVNYTYKFAEGGEAKAMLKEVGRSTQYLPADIAGSPVDLVNLGLKGVDAMTGSKLASEMPVGGAEWIIKKANEYGLMDKPTGSTTENITRMGLGVLSPTAGPRAAVAAGKAIKGTAKAALEDLSMAATGQGGSKVAQGVAKVTGLEPAFASRPKGGVSLGASSAADVPLTRMDQELKNTIEGIDTNTEQGQEVAKFFDKKMRNFYQNQYGTPDDPLFKAILENRIQPSIANNTVIAQARAGDPDALKKLRQSYDASTNVQAVFSTAALKGTGKNLYSMEKDIEKLIKQQSPGEDTLMANTFGLDPTDLEKYRSIYGPKGFKDIVAEGEAGSLLRAFNKSDLQPHVRQAVAKGEPIYASTGGASRMMPINEMRDYLFTRTPAEIKNMGVVDVAVKAREWHQMLDKASRSPESFTKKQLYAGTSPFMKLEKDSWVDVKTPEALAIEGCIMGHCVGKLPSYAKGVQEGTTKIFSLRDGKGVPHVTVQVLADSDGVFNNIAQVKGTANTAAQKYYPQIDQFLTDYSAKIGKPLRITENPVDRSNVPFLPENWRNK